MTSLIKPMTSDVMVITSLIKPVTSDVMVVTSDVMAITSDVMVTTSDVMVITSDVMVVTSLIKPVTSDVMVVTSLIKPVTSDVMVMTSLIPFTPSFVRRPASTRIRVLANNRRAPRRFLPRTRRIGDRAQSVHMRDTKRKALPPGACGAVWLAIPAMGRPRERKQANHDKHEETHQGHGSGGMQALIAGIQKHFPTGQLTVGNVVFTIAALVLLLQGQVDAMTSQATAQKTADDEMTTLRALQIKNGPTIQALKDLLLAQFGTSSQTLADFGLSPARCEPR